MGRSGKPTGHHSDSPCACAHPGTDALRRERTIHPPVHHPPDTLENEAALAQIHDRIADIRLEPGQTLYSAQDGGVLWLPTRQDMGAMPDLTVETASRLVSALRREGVLKSVDGRQARLDMEALMAANATNVSKQQKINQ
jgi:DNA-binding transcriptional regulator YhcF (GntR family)